MNLCRIESVTYYDIKALLTNIQVEYYSQRPIYPKSMDYLQSLAASYSNSLAELHSLERELQKFIGSSNYPTKKVSDDFRRRLQDMISMCKKLSNSPHLLEQLFGQTMNYKFYNKMKELLKTKNFLIRKESLTAVIQMHKHFSKISNLNSNHFLSDNDLDKILQSKSKYIDEVLNRMAQLGYLQVNI